MGPMHVHAHGHDHAAGHSHPSGEMTSGVLAGAVAATLLLVVAELLGGYLGHSISLVSDALHNLSDIPTLLISWIALHWAARPADHERTYGYQRAGVLAAFTNGILLVLVSLGLFYEAFERFLHPVAVHESWMIGVSLLALAINGGITLALVSSRRDLNLRSLLIHNFGDAISNLGILAGAIAIRMTGAQWLDPLIGVAIAAMVLWSTKRPAAGGRQHPAGGSAKRDSTGVRGAFHPDHQRRSGSSRHPRLDDWHEYGGALLSRAHSGHAHGRKRKNSAGRLRQARRMISTSRTSPFNSSAPVCRKKPDTSCRTRCKPRNSPVASRKG